jgi:hypothetical protein
MLARLSFTLTGEARTRIGTLTTAIALRLLSMVGVCHAPTANDAAALRAQTH